MASSEDDTTPAIQSQPQVHLSSGSEYLRSALLASNGTEFRREFSDVTLAYDDSQVQSYKGLLALLSPWMEQLLLVAGGHCDIVILPGICSQASPFHLFTQNILLARDSIDDIDAIGDTDGNDVKQKDSEGDGKSVPTLIQSNIN